jgi:hypothetical protein
MEEETTRQTTWAIILKMAPVKLYEPRANEKKKKKE